MLSQLAVRTFRTSGRQTRDLRHEGRPAEPVVSWPLRFVLLSFEGPDDSSRAGGLAVRVTTLADGLAARGAAVDVFFVGDPDRPDIESRRGVTLHRCCQAISAQARDGVYDAEERKIEDLCLSLPDQLAAIVGADRAAGVTTIVLAEDWHTAWPLIAIHDRLTAMGWRDDVVLAWTANNRFGFDRIDFDRLAQAATILTISRAMKHMMWGCGVNPLVVPNGIPPEALQPVPRSNTRMVRGAFAGRAVFTKVGRWDPDKRWLMAIDAVARLRDRGDESVLLARGWNGTAEASRHYRDIRAYANDRNLDWQICTAGATDAEALAATSRLLAPTGSGVIELALPVEGDALRTLYGAADMVLANSGFEPFGLVGLEAMAARGVVVTGSTGEDYLLPFRNGFALDTDQGGEIVQCLDWLRRAPEREMAMRRAAHETACTYGWSDVIERLHLALCLPEASV